MSSGAAPLADPASLAGPIDPIALLQALVRAPSPSAGEHACGDALEAALRAAGLAPRRVGANVVCERGHGPRGLLFNSHLDTVSVAPGWTRDPYGAAIEGERLFGLGSTDAKSCVAAMAAAFAALDDPGARGRIVLAATAEEETGGKGPGGSGASGLERLIEGLLPLEGAVVGEPTELHICTGQRGLVRLILHAEGKAGHASRPWEGVNAIERAADDVAALRALAERLQREARDPVLGPPTIQATLISGGTAANVIPAACAVTLDVRTTPGFDNQAAVEAIRGAVQSRLELRSERYAAVRTAPEAAIIRAARRALPEAQLRAFGGVSDLFFAHRAGVPGVLIGPGAGAQSHQADEFVAIPAVRLAALAYARLAAAFLDG